MGVASPSIAIDVQPSIAEPPPAVRAGDLANRLAERGIACRSNVVSDTMIHGVAHDSRAVRRGDLFLALPGTRDDGARYARQALAAGAVAVVCGEAAGLASHEPCMVVCDVLAAAGHVAALVYGDPFSRLQLVGVTGTNGKTSCTYLLESIWRAAGEVPGVLGTVSQRWPGHDQAAAMTTPPATEIQRAFRAMRAAGCTCVAMEVSSHALSQYRVAGCAFDAAIFTNLTRDHLDYHGDEESYFRAKARLFLDHLRPGGIAVLNADDPHAMRLAAVLGSMQRLTFSVEPGVAADVAVREVELGLQGIRACLDVRGRPLRVETRLVGRPNLANIAAVAAAADALGVALEAIEHGLRLCAPVPGRLERVGSSLPVVLVDYAHSPDALERTLQAIRGQVAGRLLAVFGCGGDRDRGKRPIMGGIAARYADVVVLTSDNPRSEDPHAILAQIEAGIGGLLPRLEPDALLDAGARGYAIEEDRERAIRTAIAAAGFDDVVVVAGKGHEDYQEIRGQRRWFDDREVVRRLQSAPAAARRA